VWDAVGIVGGLLAVLAVIALARTRSKPTVAS
jgi:hypothetical protein